MMLRGGAGWAGAALLAFCLAGCGEAGDAPSNGTPIPEILTPLVAPAPDDPLIGPLTCSQTVDTDGGETIITWGAQLNERGAFRNEFSHSTRDPSGSIAAYMHGMGAWRRDGDTLVVTLDWLDFYRIVTDERTASSDAHAAFRQRYEDIFLGERRYEISSIFGDEIQLRDENGVYNCAKV
ncbi:MAG: hypothetical protein AAFX03_09845 [Pseudomonadota bacterium]